MSDHPVSAELVAVIAAVVDGDPVVLVADDGARLPWGPLSTDHHSLQAGVRGWVERETGHDLGYVEQLYTFADERAEPCAADPRRSISVSYLGLTRAVSAGPTWAPWYEFFPWEDGRTDTSAVETMTAALRDWAGEPTRGADGAEHSRRTLRAEVTFGLAGRPWRSDLVLQRYELLYEAGLVPESPYFTSHPLEGTTDEPAVVGRVMARDHRRILATALSRLRGMIQYRPVVFELMDATFTLGQLQGVVEALAGHEVHKQNFRRLVQSQDLVEPTGATEPQTGGRPAQRFRFRRTVLDERLVAGTKLPVTRLR